MRCENIEVTFKVPMPIDRPDKNGVMYSKEAIDKAIENMINAPIVQHDANDFEKTTVLGVVTDAKRKGDYAIIDGCLWFGGTCESVVMDENNVVTSFEVSEFSICE